MVISIGHRITSLLITARYEDKLFARRCANGRIHVKQRKTIQKIIKISAIENLDRCRVESFLLILMIVLPDTFTVLLLWKL